MPNDVPRGSSEWKQALSHTLWIGGPSDAGKTTVTDILKNRRRWQWDPCDLHENTI